MATRGLTTVYGEVSLLLQIGEQGFTQNFLVVDVSEDCLIGLDCMTSYSLVFNVVAQTVLIDNEEYVLVSGTQKDI